MDLHITGPAAVDRWRTSSDFDEDRGERGDLRNGGTDATDAVLTCSERGYLHTGYLCVMLHARSTRWTYIYAFFQRRDGYRALGLCEVMLNQRHAQYSNEELAEFSESALMTSQTGARYDKNFNCTTREKNMRRRR